MFQSSKHLSDQMGLHSLIAEVYEAGFNDSVCVCVLVPGNTLNS